MNYLGYFLFILIFGIPCSNAQEVEIAKPTDNVFESTIDQVLDPTNPSDTRTFKQRFFLYSAYATGPSSPVIYVVCGEQECTHSQFILGRFSETVAKTFKAHIIALEHRYYGKSQPFDLLTKENLKYLSTDNAISDLQKFQQFAISKFGLTGKWIIMGGSYAGSLSAFYRLKHSDLVVGAYSSSAPVESKNNFEEYDAHLAMVLGPECSNAIQEVYVAANAIGEDQVELLNEFKTKFQASDIRDTKDFLYFLADVTADAVQYGYPAKLCSMMTSSNDPVETYASYVREFLETNGGTAVEYSPQLTMNLIPSDLGWSNRSWYYQSCKEYGYWQNANSDPSHSARSPLINESYALELCERLFGINEIADESIMNSKYYWPLLDPNQSSRIFFTNGSKDPWSNLSITPERGNDKNPNNIVYMIQDASHCADLRPAKETDNESLLAARKLFLELAADWLK